MSDCMTFPDTVEEFMEQYKITDTEHVYTNGIEMIPIFRMKQWFEHVSAQPEQRPLTEDDYGYCAECDPEVKCLSCGHHIAERPFVVYCNIMRKWVNEKNYCTMFEPGQEKMRKAEAQI